jgi:hypothetical protein
MPTRRSARTLAFLALLTLVVFGGALYEESFVHTDDGCSVELHCVACRLVLGGASDLPTATVFTPAAVAVAAPPVPEPVARPTASPRLVQSRAPPVT